MSSSINRSSNASKASNDFDRRASSASASASSASGGGGRAHASASATYVDPENVAKLEAITGLSRAHAMNLLEAANNKLDKAIDLHFNQPSTNKPTSSSNSKSSSSSSSSSHQTTSKKASSSSSSSSSSATNGNNKRAISDDDSSNGSCVATGDEDNVRAPIPQKIDRLLDYDPYGKDIFYEIFYAEVCSFVYTFMNLLPKSLVGQSKPTEQTNERRLRRISECPSGGNK